MTLASRMAVSPCSQSIRRAAAAATATFGLLAAGAAAANDNMSAAADAADFSAVPQRTSADDWGTGDHRSILIPAVEVPVYELFLNRFDHYDQDQATYPSPIENFKVNRHRSWVVDNDKFSTNQFLHPYSGAIYQGLARSAGLDFWQASAYSFAGSLLWEEAGENTAPSINDQIVTGIGNFAVCSACAHPAAPATAHGQRR